MKLSSLLIIDIECTCWEKEKKPQNEMAEIIEVGICLFDTLTWEPTEKASIIVKPIQSSVSQYCTNLTGWTRPLLQKSGILLSDACKQLVSVYNSKSQPWASWGDFDRIAFERETKKKDIKYPFTASHFNLKNIFAIHFGLTKAVGMRDALQKVGLTLEGKHHSGMWDAWNIGRILEKQGRF